MIGSSASLDLGKVNGPTILIVGLGNGSIDVIEVLFFYLLGKIESQDMVSGRRNSGRNQSSGTSRFVLYSF